MPRILLHFYGFLLVVLPSAEAVYHWPDDDFGKKPPDLRRMAQQVSKYLACEVCSEVVLAVFPGGLRQDLVWSEGFDLEVKQVFETGQLADTVEDADDVCSMRNLARVYKKRYLTLAVADNGTAKMTALDSTPGQMKEKDAFHWKSYALQQACKKVFSGDGDKVSRAVEEAYTGPAGRRGNLEDEEEPFNLVVAAARKGCSKAEACQASQKLLTEVKDRLEL